jgi:enoyl-CoA hydratase/carnithine racemase
LAREGAHVLVVTLDRAAVRNALSTQMGRELCRLWSDLYVDAGLTRAVVLTGAGERAFCAGADLKERQGMSDADWQRQHAVFEQMIRAMMSCPLPILAAVNGAAYAGGLELMAAADFAYAVAGARFALTEVTLGIMPGAGGTQNLPRAVGVRRAKEIVLTGLPFSAEEALAWGLINRVCPDQATLRAAAIETASRIAANAPISVRQAKKALNVATQIDLETGYQFELEAYGRTVPTADRQEGMRAFAEKRPPRYQGR